MGATHHLVLNVRFRESKSTVKVKLVLEQMRVFSMYVCSLGDIRALFMFMYFIHNRNQLIDHLGLG